MSENREHDVSLCFSSFEAPRERACDGWTALLHAHRRVVISSQAEQHAVGGQPQEREGASFKHHLAQLCFSAGMGCPVKSCEQILHDTGAIAICLRRLAKFIFQT